MKTKAAILEKIGKPLAIENIEVPKLGVGQVLVRVAYSSICGRQLGEISGAKGPDKYLPHLLGHEGGGIVLLVGEGVTKVKEGDHVCLHWRKGEGIESKPPKYRTDNGDFIGAGQIATFTELSVISENRLTPVSKDFGLDVVSLMGCSVTTGLGLINNEAKLKIGQSIAVIGCGAVGLNVIQGAAMVSGYPIIAVDINPEKLDMALEYGATYIFNYNHMGPKEDIKEIARNGGPNVVVECTGQPYLIEDAYCLVAPNGKIIMVGQPHYKAALGVEYISRHFTGKTLMDSQGGLTNPTVDIPRYLELYRQEKLKLDSLITHSFPLREINFAMKIAESGDAGKVMLEMR